MKKCLICFLCVLLLVTFSGCYIHHSNSFVEGTYTDGKFTLRVTAIDANTYKSKNGINVVEDDSTERTNKYYELELSMLDENGYIELTLYNLVQKAVKAEPCLYEDENGIIISPQEIQNKMKYIIVYNGESYTLT